MLIRLLNHAARIVMLGNYIISVFLMLCVWTLMINPPFV